jgi:DNA repair ATPase RecN
MNRSNPSFFKPTLVLTTLLGSLLLASCGAQKSAQLNEKATQPMSANAPATDNALAPKGAVQPAKGANQVAPSRPKLVKTAEIALLVNSIDNTLREASQIINQQQGDVLGLQDDKPQSSSRRQTASMQIRVPQDKLETTLDRLAKLGTIQRRQLSTEDVTTQLVDIQARLRNLRQTETSLLQIMKRSGSVGDVLKVAQELSKVRESIEQIDAQLKNLTNRVAYSTITLQLQAAVSTTASQPPLELQVKNTWSNATQSVGEVTNKLLKLAIWLVAYSPYLLLLGGAVWFGYTRRKKQPSQPTNSPSDSQLAP